MIPFYSRLLLSISNGKSLLKISLISTLAYSCFNQAFSQDISKYTNHELYPYLIRSKEILDRLEKNIRIDSLSSDPYIKIDAEAERSEYRFLSTSLKEELSIIDQNLSRSWTKFDITQYGADPTGVMDSKAAVDKAIEAAKNFGDGAEIWVPQGKYLFSGLIKLYNFNNSKFTGNNSEFIFNTACSAFEVYECRNSEISGLSIDFSILPWTQATLERIVGNDIYVRFDQGYNELLSWHNSNLRFYDANSKLLLFGAYRWLYDKPNAQKQTDGTWKLPALIGENQQYPLNQTPVGSKVVILSRSDDANYNFEKQFPDGSWSSAGFNVLKGDYLTFKKINIYAAFQAGMNTINCSGLKFIELKIMPKPGTDRLVCGNTDQNPQNSGRKGIFLYKSVLQSGNDDASCIAGFMNPLDSWKDARTIVIPGGYSPVWSTYRNGDGVWILNSSNGPVLFFAIATQVRAGNGEFTEIVLDRDVPQAVRSATGNFVLSNNSKMDGTILLDNDWSNGTAAGIRLFSSNTIVENNRVSHFFYPSTLLELVIEGWWHAGYAPRNLVFRQNKISNDNTGQPFVLQYYLKDLANPLQCIFRHFEVTGNTFTASRPLSLKLIGSSTFANNVYNINNGVGQPIVLENSCENTISYTKTLNIPGRIEAEDYDTYFDIDPENKLGKGREDGVDKETSLDLNASLSIGYLESSEWLTYKVNVTSTYYYDIAARISGFGGAIRVKVDGKELISPVNIPSTGDWQKWQDVILGKIQLNMGAHDIQFYFEKGGFNLNYLDFSASDVIFNLPTKIEAEDYTWGGEGKTYHDLIPGNQGLFYRADSVDIESCNDLGGGFNIGYIQSGEWVQYKIQSAKATNYNFTFRIASVKQGLLGIDINNKPVKSNIQTPVTGDWQKYTDFTVANVPVPAGVSSLKIKFINDGYNFNYVSIDPILLTGLNPEDNFINENIYPNPTKGRFTVQVIDNAKVSVYNMEGKKIIEKTIFKNEQTEFDLTKENEGVYTIQIHSENRNMASKLILRK